MLFLGFFGLGRDGSCRGGCSSASTHTFTFWRLLILPPGLKRIGVDISRAEEDLVDKDSEEPGATHVVLSRPPVCFIMSVRGSWLIRSCAGLQHEQLSA